MLLGQSYLSSLASGVVPWSAATSSANAAARISSLRQEYAHGRVERPRSNWLALRQQYLPSPARTRAQPLLARTPRTIMQEGSASALSWCEFLISKAGSQIGACEVVLPRVRQSADAQIVRT